MLRLTKDSRYICMYRDMEHGCVYVGTEADVLCDQFGVRTPGVSVIERSLRWHTIRALLLLLLLRRCTHD